MAKILFICLFLLTITIRYANSARILNEVFSDPIESYEPDVLPVVAPAFTFPSGKVPATVMDAPVARDTVDPPADNIPTPASTIATTPVARDTVYPPAETIPTPATTPVAGDTVDSPTDTIPTPSATHVGGDTVDSPADTIPTPASTIATTPVAGNTVDPPAETATTPSATSAGSKTVGNSNLDHSGLSFYMHDILGGTTPSGRVVTGVVADTGAGGLPFTSPSNPVFPVSGGVSLDTINDIIDNSNYPFLVGLNGQQNNNQQAPGGGSGSGSSAFVTAGQLPAGLTLQNLMFGSITVVDNELTDGHELGTHVIGRAQGFYLASSQDGSSHTLALTAVFHGGEHEHETEDTLSFFGVHRTATPVSHLAIIGGTGKYENAKGQATIETELRREDEHTTDGLETITHFTVSITE